MPKYFTLILLFIYTTAYSQTEADIRKYYTEINKKISESIKQGFEGPLYQNQIVINKNGKSWPAVGRYSDTTDYWYHDDPNHLSAAERNPRNVLLKVNMTREAGGFQVSEEYLFKDGKLLFYFSRQVEEGSMVETRLYFTNKGLLLKSSVKANELELTPKDFLDADYKEFKPSPVAVMTEAKKYQEVFLKSM
jgi:hypothetical protein